MHKLTLGIGIIFLAYTAIKSTGYYQADEHYQLIEYAGEKLETHTPDEMVWEYSRRIRPTLQPTIVFVGISLLKSIGIDNPYTQTLIFRLLSALLGVLVLLYFNRSVAFFFESSYSKTLLHFLTLFVWFMPFLMVRFSSETWSGLFFLLGLTFVIRSVEQSKLLVVSGLILGISFLFRYQIGFCILGLLLWLIFKQKMSFKSVLKLVFGLVFTGILGIIIDSWFYGQFTVAAWRFLMAVTSTAGEGFGSSAWYFYFEKLAFEPHIIFGIPFLSILFFGFYKSKSSIILWCILPFILFHFMIPHKEIRFLFPIAFLMPIAILEGLQPLIEKVKFNRFLKAIAFIATVPILIINFLALVLISQKPAGNGRSAITQYIHNHYGSQKINLIHTPWQNPYNPWNSIPLKFYAEKNLQNKQIQSVYKLEDSLIKPEFVNLLITNINPNIESDKNNFIEIEGFVPVAQNMPTWVFDVLEYTQPSSGLKLITLYVHRNQ
ncbi:MAG: hypothetical protein AB8B72_14515 [Crocinitomicaceae bacterium]